MIEEEMGASSRGTTELGGNFQFALKHGIIFLLKCTEFVMALHEARSPIELARVGEMVRECWQAW